MRIDEIMTRKSEIRSLLDSETEFDIDALTEEVRSLDAEMKEIEERNAKMNELRNNVAESVKIEINEKKEERKMENKEIRNSVEYINAYANYIKTGKDAECRALLTENGSGTVPVPTIVEEKVRTAWEKDGIMSLVRKSYMKGNIKVGFELSATGAVIHEEGDEAPDEEVLTLGVVSLVPSSIKKWITVSDEALDLNGEEFLNYIYDELTYRIAKKCADEMVAKIVALPTSATSSSVSGAKITATTIAASTIAKALSLLSDEATAPVVIMNRESYADFKAVQYANNFAMDIFENLKVLFNNSLPTFASATTGNCYAIVGDLEHGALANMPNGEEIGIKYDDLSLAESDLVKIVGRKFVALGCVADKQFVRICK